MKRLLTVVYLIGLFRVGYSQSVDTIREVSAFPGGGTRMDTLHPRYDWQKAVVLNRPFPVQSFIVPAAFIAYGATAVHNRVLQEVNGDVKEQAWMDNPHKPFHLDNYLMFAPTLSVYALNAAGIHGAHNFKDRTIILLMANVIAN